MWRIYTWNTHTREIDDHRVSFSYKDSLRDTNALVSCIVATCFIQCLKSYILLLKVSKQQVGVDLSDVVEEEEEEDDEEEKKERSPKKVNMAENSVEIQKLPNIKMQKETTEISKEDISLVRDVENDKKETDTCALKSGSVDQLEESDSVEQSECDKSSDSRMSTIHEKEKCLQEKTKLDQQHTTVKRCNKQKKLRVRLKICSSF